MVIGELCDLILVDCSDARSISVVKILVRRSSRVGKSIKEGRSVWREDRSVRAVFFGQARKARAIESDSIELPLERRLFRGGEIEKGLYFVNGADRPDLPVSPGSLV